MLLLLLLLLLLLFLNDVGFVFPDEEVEIGGGDDLSGAVLGVPVTSVNVRTGVSEAFDQVAVAGQDQGCNEPVTRVD